MFKEVQLTIKPSCQPASAEMKLKINTALCGNPGSRVIQREKTTGIQLVKR